MSEDPIENKLEPTDSQLIDLPSKKQTASKGTLLGYILIIISLTIAGLAIWLSPQWMEQLNEQKVWEESLKSDNWGAYQYYLSTYPNGKYRSQARERQMLLDFGKIENIITSDGRVFTYEGELEGGKAHGQGMATYDNGDSYEGGWVAGKHHGQGSMQFHDGSNYAGEWENGQFHGSGTLQAKKGHAYTGEWKNGKKEGQGSMTYANGDKYLGQWQGNQRQGNGTMYYANGDIYKGQWVAGLKEGKGKLSWGNSSYFQGSWQADSIQGVGTFLSRFREEIKGRWKGTPAHIRLYDSMGFLKKEGAFENGLFIEE